MDGVFFDKNLIQYSLIGYTPDCCFQSNQKNEVILCANRVLHLFLRWVPTWPTFRHSAIVWI